MNLQTMESVLNTMNVEVLNDWTSVPLLSFIILPNDGNHHYDQREQLLKFDITNEILKVKYYSSRRVSSSFFSAEPLTVNTFAIKRDGNYSYSVKDFIYGSLRDPRVGDIVYKVNSSNIASSFTKITSISEGVITTENNIILNGETLAYADGSVLTITGGEIVSKENNSFIEIFEKDESLLIYRKPLTDHIADVYIEFASIQGFALRRI
jgi:hypothetical protein